MFKEHYIAYNVWTASYLHCMSCRFIRAYLTQDNHVNWVFDNTDDRAFQLAMEWKRQVDADVNGPALMNSYKKMGEALSAARSTGVYENVSSIEA